MSLYSDGLERAKQKDKFSEHSIGVKIIDTPTCEITVKDDFCDRCGDEASQRSMRQASISPAATGRGSLLGNVNHDR